MDFFNSNKYIIKKWGFIMAKPSPSRSDLKYLFKPTVSLSKAERKDIFKRFYRTDEAHSQRGSYGLGLSIAANIAAMHRGKIWVESSNGRNIFHLELPVKSGGRCGAAQSS